MEFLTDDEAAAYGIYTGPPSREELDRMFFLDDADRGSSQNAGAITRAWALPCN